MKRLVSLLIISIFLFYSCSDMNTFAPELENQAQGGGHASDKSVYLAEHSFLHEGTFVSQYGETLQVTIDGDAATFYYDMTMGIECDGELVDVYPLGEGMGYTWLVKYDGHNNYQSSQYPDFDDVPMEKHTCWSVLWVKSATADSVEMSQFMGTADGEKLVTCFSLGSEAEARKYLDLGKWSSKYTSVLNRK